VWPEEGRDGGREGGMVREALGLVRGGADEVDVAWRERKGERVFGEMHRKREEGKDQYEKGGKEGGVTY